jgi:hypothetical protein
MHGLAFFISMLNLLRAASLYNERLTFTVMVRKTFLNKFDFKGKSMQLLIPERLDTSSKWEKVRT